MEIEKEDVVEQMDAFNFLWDPLKDKEDDA